ncbi:MAG: aminodeoxychorismate synthase component I [Gammaproteobacteria bacterium]|nr:MAG: aminodeoxychorismate synthase component I [Gammaproteobacteria bacterium]
MPLLPVDPDCDPLLLQRAAPDRYPCLLQSTACGTAQGRFDLLAAFPQDRLTLPAEPWPQPDFIAEFDRRWASAGGPPPPPGLPFGGGWFLLLGYELARQLEPRLPLPLPTGLPLALAWRIPVALIRDRRRHEAWVVAEPGYTEEAAMLAREVAELAATRPQRRRRPHASALFEPPPEEFLHAVTRARRHIAAGDIYQANLSREWHGRLAAGAGPADVYERLRETNPGPFAGLASWDDCAVLSSSPERLVSIRDGRIDTRPIAGTRPRGRRYGADAPLRAELLAHPKERAEHVMLIDLERNDLGRICVPGSVQVDEFMVVESYSHVHHIVSNVSGRLRPEVTPGDALRAVFPGGTITGCPKLRCMEIIAELERRPRGFYTGAMGYLNHDGSGDFNILIRSIQLQGRDLSFAAGSGIVADSEPERELEETRAKARGMLLALS